MSNFMSKAVAYNDDLRLAEMFDDAVGQWHDAAEGGVPIRMHEFLGMTWEQYKLVLEQPDKLLEVVRAHRAKLVAPSALEVENAALRAENEKLKAEREEMHDRLRGLLARFEG